MPAPAPRAAGAADLREALERLAGRGLARERFADEALKLIARAAGSEVGALIGCDAKRTRVFPLASLGMNNRISFLLLGQAGRWIPMRCLNEHRINVIGNAHENPFVPQAIIQALGPSSLAIAAIPFYVGSTPVGAAVLFSPNASRFTDGVLASVSQALRVCASVLAEQTPAPGEVPSAPVQPPPRTAARSVTRAPSPPVASPPPMPPPPAATAPRLPAVARHPPTDSFRSTAVPAEREVRRPGESVEAAKLRDLLQDERRRVAALERELVQARGIAERARAQLEAKAGGEEGRTFAEEAHARIALLRSALAEAERRTRPPEGAEVDPLAYSEQAADHNVFLSLVRVTDSITGLINRAFGIDDPDHPIISDLEKEIAVLKAIVEEAEATVDTAEAPLTGGSALEPLLAARAQLAQTLLRVEREATGLADLRDSLHSWRIRRSEQMSDTPQDPAESDFARDAWLIGDQMDDIIDVIENLRSRVDRVAADVERLLGSGEEREAQ